jgi:predicted nucleotidyltransferase
MDVGLPMRDVVPSAQGPVLRVLVHAGGPLTGRRVAELTDPRVSPAQTANVLRTLAASGLVDATPAGRAILFAINRDHLLYEAVAGLATARQQLWSRMGEHVRSWRHPPEAVVVFGSAARGDGDAGSDIDLLVVRPDHVAEGEPAWQADVEDLVTRTTRWTGNAVDMLLSSPRELQALARNGERVLTEIRRDGRFIVGARSSVPAPEETA